MSKAECFRVEIKANRYFTGSIGKAFKIVFIIWSNFSQMYGHLENSISAGSYVRLPISSCALLLKVSKFYFAVSWRLLKEVRFKPLWTQTVRSEDPISIVFETCEISKIVDEKYNGALWTCRQWLTCVTRSPKRRVLNFKQRFASAVCVKSSYVFHEFAVFETFFVVCSWNVKDNLW